jgi:hypothetical protein
MGALDLIQKRIAFGLENKAFDAAARIPKQVRQRGFLFSP